MMGFGQRGIAAAMSAAALASAATAADRPSKAKEATGNPLLYYSNNDYPAEALRTQQKGRVAVQLSVDATGKVVGCTIDISSGSDALDRTTCRIALERVRYQPATDARGRPIASTTSFSVRWEMPEDDGLTYIPLKNVASAAEQRIGADGRQLSCSAFLDGKALTAPDACNGSRELLAGVLPRLSAGERAAGFVLVTRASYQYGNALLPVPPSGDGGRVIDSHGVRFTVGTDGKATDCRSEETAAQPVTMLPCVEQIRFYAEEGRAMTAAMQGRWTWVTIVRPVPTGGAGS